MTIDRSANIAACLLSIPTSHTSTIVGKAITRWMDGYEIGTYCRGPILTLEQAIAALLKAG